ncbi:MAG: TM2 domain-containing protein [Bacilli bacterium]|nr:TM2 domain-containing protein [Bacilli bacterium]
MNEYVKAIDGLSLIVKLLLAIFVGLIIYGIYRIAKGKVIIGIIWIITGGLFGIGWIIDVVTILLSNKVTFLA